MTRSGDVVPDRAEPGRPVIAAAADLDPDYWSQRFDLLSDSGRLRLFVCLAQHPEGVWVAELASAAGLSQAAVSHALRLPRQRRWVAAVREGRRVRYRLVDAAIGDLVRGVAGGGTRRCPRGRDGTP